MRRREDFKSRDLHLGSLTLLSDWFDEIEMVGDVEAAVIAAHVNFIVQI